MRLCIDSNRGTSIAYQPAPLRSTAASTAGSDSHVAATVLAAAAAAAAARCAEQLLPPALAQHYSDPLGCRAV
jgi:hypothetical protein